MKTSCFNKYDLDMICVCGPGHGGPVVVGNTYLEGNYSEIYPNRWLRTPPGPRILSLRAATVSCYRCNLASNSVPQTTRDQRTARNLAEYPRQHLHFPQQEMRLQ